MAKRKAQVNQKECVSCGCCVKVCPKDAIAIPLGIYAVVTEDLCIGCGLCAKACPSSVIAIVAREEAQ